MKIAIISLGGKSSMNIAKACKKYFRKVDAINIKDLDVHLTKQGVKVEHKQKPLEKYDCIFIRGSYKYALLQRAITRAFDREIYMPMHRKAFAIGHDKFLTLVELHDCEIEVPITYYSATTELAKKILEKEVQYPVIMKVPRGTHGKGVMIADTLQSAKTILDMLEGFKEPYIIQEFVKTHHTSDIRAIVIGEKVVAAYRREAADGEIRANVHSGGKRVKHKLTKEQEEMAIKSANAIGAKICGVDILNAEKPSVIEINLSPSTHAIGEVTGINIEDEIAKYLHEQTLKFKSKLKKQKRRKTRSYEEY